MLNVSRVGTEFRVNTEVAFDQRFSTITGLEDGGFVVTWSFRSDNVKAQLHSSSGAKIGNEFLVNTTTFGGQTAASAAKLAGGGFVVSWADDGGTLGVAGDDTVRTQIYTGAGVTVGTETVANTAPIGNLTSLAVGDLANGGYVVGWTDASTASAKAQIFTATGARVGNEFLIDSPNVQFLAISGLSNGNFVVTSQDVTSRTLVAQLFDPLGARIGAELSVTATTAFLFEPAITSLSNGGFVVSWADSNPTLGDASGTGIKLQVFAADGTKVGAETLVNTQTANSQQAPTITSLSTGNFIVSWTDNSLTLGDASGASIKLQAFTNAGVKIGTELLVNTQVTNNQVEPAITGLADGRFVVSWTDNDPSGDGSGSSIKAQIFQLAGGGAPVIGSNGGGPAAAISVAEGNAAVTTITATDPDAGDVITFAIIGGADQADFVIDSATGALRFLSGPDFEGPLDSGANNGYDVVVRASDGVLFDDQALAITVTGVNEAPVILSGDGATATVSVVEGTVAATAPSVSDPDAGTIFDFAIAGGADAAFFDIDVATGALRFVTAPDFDLPADAGGDNVYDVTVRVGDGGLFDEQAIAVAVIERPGGQVARPMGTEFLVNTQTTGDQTDPVVARLANGGFVVAWTDFQLSSLSGTIRVQIFDADGARIGDEFLVDAPPFAGGGDPSIAGLPNGGFIVSWTGRGTVADAIYAQVFDSDGARVGPAVIDNIQGGTAPAASSITALTSGGFFIAWREVDSTVPNSISAIKGQLFDAAANKIGPEFIVNTQNIEAQTLPAVAGLANDGFVATWIDLNVSLGDGSSSSIKAQIFDATGARVGAEFRVNTEVAGLQTVPTVATLANGNFVITWTDDSRTLGDNDGFSVKAQIYTPSGAPIGSEFLVNTKVALSQLQPDITALDTGGFVVSWTDNDQSVDSSFSSIKAQIFDEFGAKIGAEFVVNTQKYAVQENPSIAGLGDGRLVIAWQDFSLSLGDFDFRSIKAQVFDLTEGPIDLLLSNATVVENAPDGSLVGIVTGVDPDPVDTLSYVLRDDAGGRFALDAATGALTVAVGADLDFETTPSLAVAVRVTDLSGLFYDETLTIQLIDVADTNSPPVDLLLIGGSVDENAPAGTVVGTVIGVDPGDTLRYALVDDAGGRFVLDAVTGLLSVAAGAILDFEITPSLDIVSRVTDSAGQAYEERLTIQLIDVIEGVIDASYIGTNSANSFAATPGSRWTLTGLGGADTLTGAENDDTLIGGQGNDSLAGLGGDDVFLVGAGDNQDSFDGGAEFDTIRTTAAGVVIGIAAITGIERIEGVGAIIAGTAVADALDFSATALVGIAEIRGNNGADTITGSAASDTIRGGAGIDFVAGGDGDDVFLVGAGDNQDSYDGGADFDTIRTIAPGVTIGIAAIAAIERIEGVDAIIAGTAVADGLDFSGITLIGIAEIRGNNGADTITGSADADTILGGASDDVIDGGGGDDVLAGGAGIDVLTGGTGADIFAGLAYQLRGDSIVDFGANDAIDIGNFADPAAVILSYDGTQLFIDGDGAGGRLPIAVIIGAGYANASFSAASNGVGGTLVTFEIA